MTKHEFLENIEELLEADPGSINESTVLVELGRWDSITAMGLIAMIDEMFEIILSPQKLANAKTIQDIIVLLGDKLTD